MRVVFDLWEKGWRTFLDLRIREISQTRLNVTLFRELVGDKAWELKRQIQRRCAILNLSI
mgnify:FL=1